MTNINMNDFFIIIGVLTAGLLAIVAIGFCYWLLFCEILRFFLKRLRVYKCFIDFILYKKEFYEYLGNKAGRDASSEGGRV